MARIKSGSRKFNAKHGEELARFFAEAQVKYASGEVAAEQACDRGWLIEYSSGAWAYVDTWYGGEPYIGMTTIRYEKNPCFGMTYFGRIMPYAEQEEVMQCLMEALQHPHPAHPWRGPREFISQNGMRYTNEWSGSTRRFSGVERIISSDGKETLYEANYMGGIVNQD